MKKLVLVCHLNEILVKRTGRCNLSKLARETGLSRTTLHYLANNQSKSIAFETIKALCSYLQCDIGELFTVETEDNT